MKKIFLALLLLASSIRAIDTLAVPTDYLTINSGTRANLAGNFTAIQTWGNKVRDSLAPVTSALSGTSGTLLIRSLSSLRLKLDYDNSESARLLVEGGNGDSLFRVGEDTTARFFRHLLVDSNLTVGKKLVVTDSARIPVISSALSLAQTLGVTGAITGASGTFSDLSSGRIPYAATAGKLTQDNLYWSASDDALGIGDLASTPFDELHIGRAKAGGEVAMRVENRDTTSASSTATIRIMAGNNASTNVGDAELEYHIVGVQGWVEGIDHSDSNSYVIGTGNHLGLANRMRITPAGATRFPGPITTNGDLTMSETVVGSDASLRITNPDNTNGSSVARLLITTGGASSGDPIVNWGVSGATNWAAGIDNSASDNWVLAASGTLGSSNALSVTTAGNATVTGSVTADSLISSKFYTEGTFTLSASNFSSCTAGSLSGSNCNVTAKYVRVGKQITLCVPPVSGTSSDVVMYLTGFPAGIAPSSNLQYAIGPVTNSGTDHPGTFNYLVGTAYMGYWSSISAHTSTFASSGTKGFSAFCATYTQQ